MLYELTCLTNPDFNENELGEFSDKLSGLLSKSGKIVKTSRTGRVKLQYKIKQNTNAFLVSFIFELEPKDLDNINTELDKDTNIIRFLIIKTKIEKESEPRLARKETTEKPEVKDKEAKVTKTEDKKEKAEEKPEVKEKPKKEAKVSMDKIETELNKILDES